MENKGQEEMTTKKEEGNPSCTHCKKYGHDDEHCWKLHPDLNPKRFGGKGKPKMVATMQKDLGSDSGDEMRITVVGVQGKSSFHAGSSSTNTYHDHERRRSELFHIRVVSKHTNIDTLFDLGSQVNLIS
jgi:hypothetical protein